MKKIRIGELLVQKNLLTNEQLNECLAKQKKDGGKLGKIVVELGFISEQQLINLLSSQLQIPIIDLKQYDFDEQTIHKLPEAYARRFRALALVEHPDHFLIGMSDPLDLFAFDELSRILKKPIKMALISEKQLLQTIDVLYRHTQEISHFAEELSDELQRNNNDFNVLENLTAEEAPVVKLLQSLFIDAIQIGASDIHIEPDEQVLRIRQRIDGVLHEHIMKETAIGPALTQRLKLMANLNIAEKRLPQDGRFQVTVKNKNIDIRLSTLPTQYGESVVLRLLDQSNGVVDLKQLGMPEKTLKTLTDYIHLPQGLILVTGPTGSGKTTTLYAMLNELNQSDKKIITVEDPVEYRLPRITQVQVNNQIELNFARILRTALRQDPDILLVGEIRDTETAQIALRASLTGHMVFATLHTNDAASSALRLIDMEIDSYLVAATLNVVLAQRLIRKICSSCKEPYQPTSQEIIFLKNFVPEYDPNQYLFKYGKGCTQCNYTGYSGRSGVFELLIMTDELLEALRTNDHHHFQKAVRNNPNFENLGKAALNMAYAGITTLSEALPFALNTLN